MALTLPPSGESGGVIRVIAWVVVRKSTTKEGVTRGEVMFLLKFGVFPLEHDWKRSVQAPWRSSWSKIKVIEGQTASVDASAVRK